MPTPTNFDTLIATGLPVQPNVPMADIATTGAQEVILVAAYAGTLASVALVAKAALAANDTNFLTFTLTNKGQAGAGATAMLAATDPNTTKATGGAAIAAYTKRAMTLNATAANLVVAAGDVLSFIATATGTLAGAVTKPTLFVRITPT